MYMRSKGNVFWIRWLHKEKRLMSFKDEDYGFVWFGEKNKE